MALEDEVALSELSGWEKGEKRPWVPLWDGIFFMGNTRTGNLGVWEEDCLEFAGRAAWT